MVQPPSDGKHQLAVSPSWRWWRTFWEQRVSDPNRDRTPAAGEMSSLRDRGGRRRLETSNSRLSTWYLPLPVQGLLSQVFPVLLQAVVEVCVVEGEDRDGQQGGVGGTVDGDGGDRDSGRHLDGGEKSIHPI